MLNDYNNRRNYVLIAEDNPDDVFLYKTVFRSLNIPNRLAFVSDGEEAFTMLKTVLEIPFIIISDINMPRVNGIELKEMISRDMELQIKSIPFVFISSSASIAEVNEAYKLSAQGYFQKPVQIEQLERIISNIYSYWTEAQLPRTLSL